MNPRKLEHRFRMILAGIPYTFLCGHQGNDVPTFWLLPQVLVGQGTCTITETLNPKSKTGNSATRKPNFRLRVLSLDLSPVGVVGLLGGSWVVISGGCE